MKGKIINMIFDKIVNIYLKEEKLSGGKGDGMSIQDLAELHGVSIDLIKDQLRKGIEIEYEHTNDPDISREISIDHIAEIPDYYDRLIKMEKDAEQKLREAMTAATTFGSGGTVGQMGGKQSSDFYATGDTRIPKSLFGVLRRQPRNINEKGKKRKKKKVNINSSNS
jgi:hypothetical protein